MPVKLDTLNKNLYDVLRSRGYDPVSLNSKGDPTDEIEKADVFRFTYRDTDRRKKGQAWATNEGNELVLYIDDGFTKNPEFENFTQFMKRWAQKRLLGFKITNKDHLVNDMKKRTVMNKKEDQLNEGYYAMGKKASYNDSIPTVKVIIQHSRQLEEGEQRFRNIARIFVENATGERFLVPTTRPGLARVYARHIAEGGTPYDDKARHITSLVEEYTKMAGFVRATRRGQFNESAVALVNEGLKHYNGLRMTLQGMTSHRGYNNYFESYTPVLNEETTDTAAINELFVQEKLDPRIESVLPILNRLSKNITEMSEVKELESWATAVTEGEERPYVCVHAKKGKHECRAASSYEAAKKAAEHWKLKSTAGIDAYLADVTHTPVDEAQQVDEPGYSGSPAEIKAKYYHDIAQKKKLAKQAAEKKKTNEEAEQVDEVDTGQAGARKTAPSSKEKQEQVFAKHKERMKKLAKEYEKAEKDEAEKQDTYSKKYPGGEKQKAADKAAFMKRFANEEVKQANTAPKDAYVAFLIDASGYYEPSLMGKPDVFSTPEQARDYALNAGVDGHAIVYYGADGKPKKIIEVKFEPGIPGVKKIRALVPDMIKRYKGAFSDNRDDSQDDVKTWTKGIAEQQVDEVKGINSANVKSKTVSGLDNIKKHLMKTHGSGQVQFYSDDTVDHSNDETNRYKMSRDKQGNPFIRVDEAPGAQTLAHNQRTAEKNLKAFGLAEGRGNDAAISAIINRILRSHTELLSKYGPKKVLAAVQDAAMGLDDLEEIGTSDVSGWVNNVIEYLKSGHYDHIDEDLNPAQKSVGQLGPTEKAKKISPALGKEQINEFFPAIAAGARLALPLLIRLGPKLAKIVKSGAKVAGQGAKVAGKGAAQAAKGAGEIAAKNAPAIGVGIGAYDAITDTAEKATGGVGEVYTDVKSAASAIADKVGTAIDSKSILDLANMAVKFALPVGIVLAVLYGGKKLIDKVMAEPEHNDATTEDLDANQRRVGQLGPTERAKKISPVLGKEPKQHPFKGKLVGASESAEMARLKTLSGIK